jgi:hypothetical protein
MAFELVVDITSRALPHLCTVTAVLMRDDPVPEIVLAPVSCDVVKLLIALFRVKGAEFSCAGAEELSMSDSWMFILADSEYQDLLTRM